MVAAFPDKHRGVARARRAAGFERKFSRDRKVIAW